MSESILTSVGRTPARRAAANVTEGFIMAKV